MKKITGKVVEKTKDVTKSVKEGIKQGKEKYIQLHRNFGINNLIGLKEEIMKIKVIFC